jgi:hypothetical protein
MPPFLQKNLPRWIWWVLIYLFLAAARIGWIWYDRSRPLILPNPRPVAALKSNPDALVVIPRFRISDFKEASSLVGRTLWWKAGFQSPFYLLDSETKKIQSNHPLFLPTCTPLQVEDIFELKGKGIYLVTENRSMKCTMAIAWFDPQDQVYRFLLDDLFFPDDPFRFYSHWGTSVRQAIQSHQIQPGMTFAQVALSLGAGQLIQIENNENQIYHFPSLPGGKPGTTEVHFTAGKLARYKIL